MSKACPLQPPALNATLKRATWGTLYGAALSLTLSQIIQQNTRPFLIITPDTLTATRLEDELRFFLGPGASEVLWHFPDWETLPYDQFSPHQDIISERLAALTKIPYLNSGAIITPIATLLQRLAPRDFIQGQIFLFATGAKLARDEFRLRLTQSGYRAVEQVREHGEFAIRGALLDLFPMGSALPFRIDLFDDEIESIRTFSPDTQRTIDVVPEIKLLPAHEFPTDDTAIELFRGQWRSQFTGNPLNCPIYQDVSEGICPPGIEYYLPLFFKTTASLFDYLPQETSVITLGNLHLDAENFMAETRARYTQRAHDATRPLLPPEQVFISVPEVFNTLKRYPQIKLQPEPVADEQDNHNFATTAPPTLNIEHKAPEPLRQLQTFLSNNPGRVLFCAESSGRREVLLQLLQTLKIYPKSFSSWAEFLLDEQPIGITVAPLDQGLCLTEPALNLIAESQLFGHQIMQRRRRKATTQDLDTIVKDLTELQIGAPIVHIDHGVGRYLGLQTLTVNQIPAEFLTLEYSGGDKLYVPVTALHLINRYSGLDPEHAPLHKLGTEQWSRAKKKAAEQVHDVAAELLNIYAERAAREGFNYEIDATAFTTFAAAFPFETTPDQEQAIQAVAKDMASTNPMDRLVCGDVGFGKTEVAMRAAFIAVQNNKQVAVLVPTTLLAQQHFQTFQDRFADLPVTVAVISRFKTSKEQQELLQRLSDGKIDIIIGTHKLLQPSIRFKDLGLLIIDEEHRFGVQQKERIKALRSQVDILTLTATPIPRTLNMAFSGIRDLSLIATPPAKRLSIKTFVHEIDNTIIKEAIARELLRGGQVYFLHNDVATIHKTARDLATLVPEARIGVAHGQMRERELEQVMADFYHRRFNVLICTTIIESGIDIPSANTIIIERADKFGLAQLHQLRGRVGRSHHQAYAYLLTPPHVNLTPDAQKRLDAISQYEDLGVGFTLATHDLEIRGAGELLGQQQSGQMQEVGFTLYMDLLSRAVETLKSGTDGILSLKPPITTDVDLHIPALIPETYLADVHLRLQCYKKIASAKSDEALDDIQVEMIDRFGLLPPFAKNLFAIASIKLHAEQLGISKIDVNQEQGKLEFHEKPNVDPLRIINLIQTQPKIYRLEGPTRLRFVIATTDAEARIKAVNELLQKLKSE